MSFESKMKKRGNKKLNQFAKNPYRKPWYNRIPLWSKIAVPASLMALASAFAVIMILPKVSNGSTKAYLHDGDMYSTQNAINSSNDKAAPNSQPYSNYSLTPSTAQGEGSSYYEEPWDNRAINNQYRMLLYNGDNYYSYQTYPAVEEQYIGEYLDTTTVWGEEPVYNNPDSTYIRHETTGLLYRVNGFDPSLLIAVKFNEDEGYYWYKNVSDYSYCQTMGEFLNKINLNEVASFPRAFYDVQENETHARYQYNNLDKDLVLNTFFSNPDAAFCKEVELPGGVTKYYSQYTNYISIPIYIPRLHLTESSNGASGFSIYDNGFLELTFMNKKDWFYVGEEAYQTFKDYLLNNLSGELLEHYYQ